MGYERNTGRYYRDDGRSTGYRDHRDDYREHGRDHSRDDYRARGGDHERYDRPRAYDGDRGFFDRAGDEVRSWFGDEEAERRRRWDERLREREDDRRYADGGRFADNARYGGGGFTGAGQNYRPSFNDYGAGRGAGATSTFGLGGGADHDGWGAVDPSYSAWRRRQVAELDRDYDEYRRENESRFHNDFGSWRSNRQTQRQSLSQAQEHQEVVGSDGTHVGKVDHVRGDRILLTKSDKDAGGRHHSIPASWIANVGDKVTLNRTAAQAQQAWKEEAESGEGPHYLNRAFTGTY